MTLRELLDTLAAHAGGDDGLSPELQAEIENTIGIVDQMWYIVSDHAETLLNEWFVHKDEDDRLFQDEEEAYIGGAALMGETIDWPEGYLEQGKELEND